MWGSKKRKTKLQEIPFWLFFFFFFPVQNFKITPSKNNTHTQKNTEGEGMCFQWWNLMSRKQRVGKKWFFWRGYGVKFEKKVNLILIPRENGERDARAIIKKASREEKPLMEEGERKSEWELGWRVKSGKYGERKA